MDGEDRKLFFLDHVGIVEELGCARMNSKCQPCLFASHFLTQFCCHHKRHPQTCRPMWHPADLLRSCLASKATWFCKGYSSKKERMKHTLMLLTPSLITKGTRKALNFEDVHIKIHLESWTMNLGLTEFPGSCYARHPGTSTSQVPTWFAGCRRRSVTWPWMPQCVVWGNKSHRNFQEHVFFWTSVHQLQILTSTCDIYITVMPAIPCYTILYLLEKSMENCPTNLSQLCFNCSFPYALGDSRQRSSSGCTWKSSARCFQLCQS